MATLCIEEPGDRREEKQKNAQCKDPEARHTFFFQNLIERLCWDLLFMLYVVTSA